MTIDHNYYYRENCLERAQNSNFSYPSPHTHTHTHPHTHHTHTHTHTTHTQMACLGPTQESSKQEVSRVLHERDQLRSRLIERKRDNQKLQEKLSNANRMLEAGKGDAPTDQRVAELQVGVVKLCIIIDFANTAYFHMAITFSCFSYCS